MVVKVIDILGNDTTKRLTVEFKYLVMLGEQITLPRPVREGTSRTEQRSELGLVGEPKQAFAPPRSSLKAAAPRDAG